MRGDVRGDLRTDLLEVCVKDGVVGLRGEVRGDFVDAPSTGVGDEAWRSTLDVVDADREVAD